jgi:hypothetical protein
MHKLRHSFIIFKVCNKSLGFTHHAWRAIQNTPVYSWVCHLQSKIAMSVS